jgi:hypothetical protein
LKISVSFIKKHPSVQFVPASVDNCNPVYNQEIYICLSELIKINVIKNNKYPRVPKPAYMIGSFQYSCYIFVQAREAALNIKLLYADYGICVCLSCYLFSSSGLKIVFGVYVDNEEIRQRQRSEFQSIDAFFNK